MIYKILADTVLIIHLLFILFVVFGALLVFRHRYWAWLQIPAALWGVIIELKGWVCPLTPLENWFLRKGGAATYPGNFIEHYLSLLIYPPFLTENIQIFFATSVFIINISAYLCYYQQILSRRAH
ncbi:MAG: DUF2784 domain-containing protein [Desulfobulbaceae bacterium]|nr:DUF2784 domain-containing protein [Desulfobulbaceae bacterium]